MTTIQLAQRIARNLSETDITRMPAALLAEVLDAENAALQRVFAMLPRHLRETTISETLFAPETVDVTIAARKGNALTGEPFTAAMRGCSVRLTDDDHFNEVVEPNFVLDSFLGQQLTGQATVWHDCIQLFQVIEEVTSPVRVYDLRGADFFQPTRELVRNQRLRTMRYRYGYYERIGTPREYAVESVGMAQGGEPASYLRLYPMPDRDLRVRFEALVQPLRITFRQLSGDAVPLPVPDALCESALVPIACAQMATSQWWTNPRTKEVQQAATDAAAMLALQPTDAGPGGHRIGTPWGF